MTPRISIAARFWLGAALPTLALVLFILFLVFATGGKETGPVVVLIVSIVAVPATMLANCWVLFVNWNRRVLLFAGGLAVPSYVGCAMAIFLHGPANDANVGLRMIAPLFMIPNPVKTRDVLAMSAIWLLGIIALVVLARALAQKDEAAS
jgi:hypothetical protein